MDYPTFQKLIRRYVSSVRNSIEQAYPNAPDRSFAENSILIDWGRELTQDGERKSLAETVELLYRLGEPLEEILEAVLLVFSKEDKDMTRQELIYTQRNSKDAFKYIAGLFAYRILIYKQQNPNHPNPSIVDALPPATKTARDLIMGTLSTEDSEKSKYEDDIKSFLNDILDWTGLQSFLAALLITLVERGYLSKLPKYSFIKAIFSNANTIDQFLRPGVEEGESQYPRIPKKAFDAFKDIKQNKERPK